MLSAEHQAFTVASYAVDTSLHLANARAKTELGRQPRFPTYRDAIAAMAAQLAAAQAQQVP